MKRNHLFYIIALVLFAYSCSKEPNDEPSPQPKPEPPKPSENDLTFPKKEMRAVWITTAWGLDWPRRDYSSESQKAQYIKYLDKFSQLNINAVFFQVKPMGDAFYESPYEPWSAYITGVRGQKPNYDVLKFMIDEAHKRDIQFHAWMNPYRIATRSNSSVAYPPLHSSIKSEWVVNHEKIQIYNPAIPEIVTRLTDIVKDLITKYDVDGVHFDDYFYPDPSSAGTMVSDKADFEKYGSGYSTVEAFRRDNVNKAIKTVSDMIVSTKPHIVFSVSPAPNEDYNLNILFADVKKWCQEGWIDIVIPQLYQEIGNPYNDFQNRLTWWSQYNYKAALMVGHGYYKFGDSQYPSAFQSTDELERQFNLTKRNQKVVGNVMYRAEHVLLNKIGITDKLASLYEKPALMPFIGRKIISAPKEPTNVKIEDSRLIWDSEKDVKSVVYYFADVEKEGSILAITNDNAIDIQATGYYCVSTINKQYQESKPSRLIKK